MKFDIVVGNPPYQDKDVGSKKKLWPDFIIKSSYILKDRGFLAIVCPPSWMSSGLLESKRKLYDLISKHACVVNVDVSDAFPNAGTKASYFILRNNVKTSFTKIINKKAHFTSNLSNLILIPLEINPFSLSILDKVFSNKYSKLSFSVKAHAEVGTTKDRHSYAYSGYHGGLEVVNIPKESKNKLIKKVLISRSGYPKIGYDDGQYCTTASVLWTEVRDTHQGQSIMSMLNTVLFQKIIGKICKYDGFNCQILCENLPKLDTSIIWSDDLINKEFDLTKEEIDYIIKV